MSQHELEIEHDGNTYIVHIDADWEYIDDSFDGHLGGRVHTFEAGHWQVEDYRVEECYLVTEDDDEEIDYEIVHGLEDAINSAVSELTRDHD